MTVYICSCILYSWLVLLKQINKLTNKKDYFIVMPSDLDHYRSRNISCFDSKNCLLYL